MPKLIQVCGINGTGKTTLMRKVIAGQPDIRKIQVAAGSKQFDVLTNDTVCVLGRYGDCACAGIDGYIRDKDELKALISNALRLKIAPVVLFESVIYGLTFKFRKGVADACRQNGYEYQAVQLIAPVEMLEQRIYERNGGKRVNMEMIYTKQKNMVNGGKHLRQTGEKVLTIDTSNRTPDEVSEIVKAIMESRQ